MTDILMEFRVLALGDEFRLPDADVADERTLFRKSSRQLARRTSDGTVRFLKGNDLVRVVRRAEAPKT